MISTREKKKNRLKRKDSYVSRGKLENKYYSPNKACLFVLATTHRPALTHKPVYAHCTAEQGETAKAK